VRTRRPPRREAAIVRFPLDHEGEPAEHLLLGHFADGLLEALADLVG
jgi:hypothetical protein